MPSDKDLGSDIEVCIVAYDSAQFIENWRESADVVGCSSIAIVDNHASGSTIEVVRNSMFAMPVRTMALPHNPGFAAACNALAHTSNAKWLLFLNPDAKVLRFSQNQLRTGTMFGATQHRPDGSWVHASGRDYKVRHELTRSWLRLKQKPANGGGFVSGGAMLIERAVFLRVGGFDESFFLFYEDIDLGLRLTGSGVRVCILADWIVEHEVGASARKDWAKALQYSYASGLYFHRKQNNAERRFSAFIAIDAALRATYFQLRNQPNRSKAYRELFRTSMRALAFGGPKR